jgi:hypothetical protein
MSWYINITRGRRKLPASIDLSDGNREKKNPAAGICKEELQLKTGNR